MSLYKATNYSYDAHWNSIGEYIGIFEGNSDHIKMYLHKQGYTNVELMPVIVQHITPELNRMTQG